jgi:hypothetical protein
MANDLLLPLPFFPFDFGECGDVGMLEFEYWLSLKL